MSYEITLFSNVNTSTNNIDEKNISSNSNENQSEKTNKNSITIFLCLNGADKSHFFPLKIEDYKQKTLRYLKDQISKQISSLNIYKNQNKTVHSIFTLNEILINDYDIQYFTENEILFFTLNSNEQFNSSNHYNIYNFNNFINSGGYAKVFIANNIITNKIYAIKCIEINNFSQEELYNISREKLILHSLNHTGIIKLYDSFQYDNKFYSVMDYCKGGELEAYLKEKKFLSEKEAKNIFKQIYNAVKYIHSQNIIHRDLKPNNILFKDEEKKNIVLIDFGISGYKNGKNYDKIKAGTFRFVPPEILEGNFESNTKIDIWSLGLILYRMIFGKFPFEGKNNEEIGWKILNEKIDFDVFYNNNNKRKKIFCSREIKDLLNGMLEKNYLLRIDDDCDLFEKWFDANDDEKFIKTINSVKNNNYNNPFEIESKSKKYKKNAYLNPSLHNKIININRLKMIKNNNNFADNNFINVKNKFIIDGNSNKKNILPIINNNNNINNINKFNNPKKEKLKLLNKSKSVSKIIIFSAEKNSNKNKLNEIYNNSNNNNNFDIKTKLKKLNFRNKSKKSLFSTNQLLN